MDVKMLDQNLRLNDELIWNTAGNFFANSSDGKPGNEKIELKFSNA